MAEQLKTLAGQVVDFSYDGEARMVEVETVKECGNGNRVLVGKDFHRNMAYRSFTINRIQELSVRPKGWATV